MNLSPPPVEEASTRALIAELKARAREGDQKAQKLLGIKHPQYSPRKNEKGKL